MAKSDVHTSLDWDTYYEQHIVHVLTEYPDANMVNLRLAIASELADTPYGRSLKRG